MRSCVVYKWLQNFTQIHNCVLNLKSATNTISDILTVTETEDDFGQRPY
jgi:hypothetical protein